jgi:hypothetical protein
MSYMMSVEYAFSLSLVFYLVSASDTSVLVGQGAETARPVATA